MITEANINARAEAARRRNEALIEELEFLLQCNVGEAAILQAFGYRQGITLKRQLQRLNRRDLIPRIFEWDAMVNEQQHPKGRAA
jgi:hypothetical protein